MTRFSSRKSVRALAVAGVAALALTGCTKTAEPATEPAGNSEAAAQEAVNGTTASGGKGCTAAKYGVEPVEMSEAVVGFSQSEPDTAAFRAAETASIKETAKEKVADLIVTNADGELPKQIADIRNLLNQGVDLLIVAPVNSDGLDPALNAAKKKGVPVITIDRKVTNTWCEDYVTFIGSDFYDQGMRAADAMAEATDGKANVAILLGSSGNNVTDNRNAGFIDQVEKEYPEMEIVAQQTANFARDEGQTVTEQLLQANPDIDAIYAHNDEMGLGAVTAIRAAGKDPGQDVKVVSVDGTANAVQGIVDGDINAVIESNPRFGPLAFQVAEEFWGGEAILEDITIVDGEYTPENAEDELGNAF